MGTMLQKYNLKEEDFRKGLFKNHKQPLIGNYDLLSLTYPEIVKEIHRKYFEAGADICKTNTFSGTSVVQADYNLESVVYDRSEEHTSELQSRPHLVCRLLLEKKNKNS